MQKKVISFHYKVTNKQGGLIDSSEGKAPLTFLEGAGQIIRGLEGELIQLKKGDKKNISVSAEDAYGPRDESLVFKVSRSQLPSKVVKVGDRFNGGSSEEGGSGVFTVMEVTESDAVLDGNHPLAGSELTFDVEIVEIRLATEDELKHGHAHGAGGHHH